MENVSVTQWAKVIDHTRCIGCHACSTACKSENEVPLSVNRTYVKYIDVGAFPNVRRAFQVTRCNQCADAPCTHACPTAAMFTRRDGIIDFDKSACIGCKACIAACPYDAIFITPDDHSAEKCNFCTHRIDMGLEPACVVMCPTEAILIGDLNDPDSKVAQIVGREAGQVRRPEKETRPKLFYKGAHQATLDPLAARRPAGGLFLWSEQPRGRDIVSSGSPNGTNSSPIATPPDAGRRTSPRPRPSPSASSPVSPTLHRFRDCARAARAPRIAGAVSLRSLQRSGVARSGVVVTASPAAHSLRAAVHVRLCGRSLGESPRIFPARRPDHSSGSVDGP